MQNFRFCGAGCSKIENRPGKLSEGYLNRVNLYKTGYEYKDNYAGQ